MSDESEIESISSDDSSTDLSSFERLAYIFKTVDTLPKKLAVAFEREFGHCCDDFLDEISDSLPDCLCDDREWDITDITRDEASTLMSCMAGSPSKGDMRRIIVGEPLDEYERGKVNLLERLCRVEHDLEPRCLETLKVLRDLNLFHKRDIQRKELLSNTCKPWKGYESERGSNERRSKADWANRRIFDYLVEWDPDALWTTSGTAGVPLHVEIVECSSYDYCDNFYPIDTIKMVLQAGLSYFPNDLVEFLVLDSDWVSYASKHRYRAFEMEVNAGHDSKLRQGWTIIEECLEEMVDLKLHEPHPETNLYPFMAAAADQSCDCCVDLIYYLLTKDPCVLLGFNTCAERQMSTSACSSRKRKAMQKTVYNLQVKQ
jgi:hypothetical protein